MKINRSIEEKIGFNLIVMLELLEKGALKPIGEMSAHEWAIRNLAMQYKYLLDNEKKK